MDLFDAAAIVCDGISTAFRQKKGYLVGRNGTIEMQTLLTKRYITEQVKILERNAGVFPSSQESIFDWINATEQAIQNTDVLVAGWYAPIRELEMKYLKGLLTTNVNATNASAANAIPLRVLEPYYVPESLQWSRHLHWKKVAVVTSFAETAKRQLARRTEIWGDRADSLLPDAEYTFIQTGYSPVLVGEGEEGRGAWPTHVSSWKDAVNYVVKKVVDSDSDIVLIGCGGLGMIIGAELKARGKICIVMGGAIQVLFGIKGKRWENHSVIRHFWNDAWVYPSAEETPLLAHSVEGRCYW